MSIELEDKKDLCKIDTNYKQVKKKNKPYVF